MKIIYQTPKQTRIRKETNVTSSHQATVIFIAVVFAFIVGLPLGGLPLALFLLVVLPIVGICEAKKEDEEKANRLIHDENIERQMLNAMRHGKRELTVRTEIEGVDPDLPLLGKLVFGNRLTKETRYYLDD